MSALSYLEEGEWKMGNGQCPDCCGVHAGWFGHPLYLKPGLIGHKADCNRAAAIKELGGTPLMLGEFKSDAEFEGYVTPTGILSTRVKTSGVPPCPRLAEMNRDLEAAFYSALCQPAVEPSGQST